MTFERTSDYALIREIMTNPRIYPFIADDSAPAAEDFQPVEHSAFWYVLVKDEAGEVLGLFLFAPQGSACWEVHTCLLPTAWGQKGAAAARELPAWIWANTDCRRVVTTVPKFNKLALRFAERAGMTEYGRNPKSYRKHGILHDQILLGISPTEI